MLFTFENGVPLIRYGGVSDVASFITTNEQLQLNRGCCFLEQAMHPEGFLFHLFNFAIGHHDVVYQT